MSGMKFNGEPLYKYCARTGKKVNTIYKRIRSGMSVEEACTKEVRTFTPYEHKHKKFDIDGMSAAEFSRSIGKSSCYLSTLWRQQTRLNKSFRRPDLTIQQLAEEIKSGKRYKPDTGDYFISTYCRNKGYNYSALYTRWCNRTDDTLSFREFVKQWEKDNGKTS